MTQDELKALVAQAAVTRLASLQAAAEGLHIGVGTGSTVNCFIEALGRSGLRIATAVSSSLASSARLQALGVPLREANELQRLAVYVDGADEIDPRGCMIKGGGAALTREKIVADLAEQFWCIVDESKQVQVLGRYPLPVEVIPMARCQVIRRFDAMPGVRARWREGVVTDNGGHLVDVRGLQLTDPLAAEAEFSQWPGVVTVGVFARHRAHRALVGTPQGVRDVSFPPR